MMGPGAILLTVMPNGARSDVMVLAITVTPARIESETTELRPLVPDHLALLTESAGDDLHLGSAGGIMGDGRSIAERFVIGMGMDEEQPM